jgi:predicted alpha/beta hydrolase
VALQTTDGVILRGHLYSAPGPQRKVLVLIGSDLPQVNRQPHISEFTSRGIAILTFDLRSQGETGGPPPQKEGVQIDLIEQDLELAIGFIKSRGYPLVYVMGLGANVADATFGVAARHDLAGVGGLPVGTAAAQVISRVTERKLLMASDGDAVNVSNLNRAAQAAPEPITRVVYPAGTQQERDLLSRPVVKQAILDFVSR